MAGGEKGPPAELASHEKSRQFGKSPQMAAWEHRAKRAFTGWRTADLLQLLISLCAIWCRNKASISNPQSILLYSKSNSPFAQVSFLHARISNYLATGLALYPLKG